MIRSHLWNIEKNGHWGDRNDVAENASGMKLDCSSLPIDSLNWKALLWRGKRMSVSQLLSLWRFFLHFINSINPFITDTIQSIILLSLKRTIILSFSEGALIIWFPLLRRIAPLFSQIYFNTWQNVSWILGLSLAKLHWRRLHRSVFALKMWVLSIICKYLLWVLTLEN